MVKGGRYSAGTGGTTPLRPLPLLRAPLPEKRLDAALLAVVRRRKREQSVFPGVPFN
jgi:hypothetical protein